jgi:very-short-patch-repair endonuclease
MALKQCCAICGEENNDNKYSKAETCGSKSCAAKLQHMRSSDFVKKNRSENISVGVSKQWQEKRGTMLQGICKWHSSDDGMKFHKTLSIKLNYLNSPNMLEVLFSEIIRKSNRDFEFVGNGTKWIAGKNPDFINEKDKKIIELYGDYWHKNDTEEQTNNRIDLFRSAGYETLIVWASELKHRDRLENKIEGFIND